MPVDDVRVATAAAYDRIVDEFVRRNTEINDDLFDFRQDFMQVVGEGGLVVDVGCGPGRDSRHFRTHGLRSAGLDASAGMARRALSEGVPVVIADMRTMPVRFGALDGIWSAASLFHVPRAEVPEMLVAWKTLLRSGGVLGLSTSLGEDEGWERCPYDPTTQHDRINCVGGSCIMTNTSCCG